MARMYEHSVSGRSEREISAELHHENIRSRGEWIETRLLTVGDHTNPRLSECSGRIAAHGEMLSLASMRRRTKLETQVLVTDTGDERLDSFPWEDG